MVAAVLLLVAAGGGTLYVGSFKDDGSGRTSIPAPSLTGNLAIVNFNGGGNASSGTFWRGDGTWSSAGAGSSNVVASIKDDVTTNVVNELVYTVPAAGMFRVQGFINASIIQTAETNTFTLNFKNGAGNGSSSVSVTNFPSNTLSQDMMIGPFIIGSVQGFPWNITYSDTVVGSGAGFDNKIRLVVEQIQ